MDCRTHEIHEIKFLTKINYFTVCSLLAIEVSQVVLWAKVMVMHGTHRNFVYTEELYQQTLALSVG